MEGEKEKSDIFIISESELVAEPFSPLHTKKKKKLITFLPIIIVDFFFVHLSFEHLNGCEAIYTVINCILRFADKTLPSLSMRNGIHSYLPFARFHFSHLLFPTRFAAAAAAAVCWWMHVGTSLDAGIIMT